MINIDSLTLKLLEKENREFLIGAKIQKIQQAKRYEIILTLRNFGVLKKFYININPNYYHLCFMSEENEKKRNIEIPKTAPMFCMLLRKYILNAKIINTMVPEGERIFEIYFEYSDELNEKSILCLAVELMGKYSNIILYNYDTNIIIGCNHNVGSEKSRYRELCGMLPYIYPPKRKKKTLTKVSLESFLADILDLQDIVNKYKYITVPLIEEIYSKCNSYKDLYFKLKDFLNTKEFTANISIDYSKYFLFKFDNSRKCSNINEMIDEYYAFHQNRLQKESLKSKIIKYIKNRLEKLKVLKEEQQNRIDKINEAITIKNKADVLMANLNSLKKGISKADLFDFNGNKITIDLDENLSLIENANKFYNLYKKIKASYEHSKLMMEETDSEILYFQELMYFTENTENINELQEIYNELFSETYQKEDNNINVDFIIYKDFKIYIGKNKKQNDYILSKLSSGEDLWFHPLNSPGAHILIKTNNKDVDTDTLLKAAQLTKEFSSQKNNSKTSIIYTKRKYLKKAKNKIAFVTYKNETEIVI